MQNKVTYAVIDLGTNTFHLLIATCKQNKFVVLHEEKDHVGLGREGIGIIAQPAIDRAKKTIYHFSTIIGQFPNCTVKAFGTAALRLARNQSDFVQEILEHTGIKIEVIDGLKEAALIHKGVLSELLSPNDNFFIMDIGGGSVEFIHSQMGQSQWFQSFDVGIALLENTYHNSDPISSHELQKLESFLEQALLPMNNYWNTLSNNRPNILIGASGSFEIIFQMLRQLKLTMQADIISTHAFDSIYKRFVSSSQDDRRIMEYLPKERQSIIVMAIVLIEYILKTFGFDEIRYSPNALKEGVMMDFCSNNKA